MSKSVVTVVLGASAMLFAIVLVGCSDEPDPTPTATLIPTATPAPTSTPTATAVPPTTTPAPTATPEPSVGFKLLIDRDTTWQEVFDAFTPSEQDCIRDGVDSATLGVYLGQRVLAEGDTEEWDVVVYPCIAPDTARSLAYTLLVEGLDQLGWQLGTAELREEDKSCLRDWLAGVDFAALIVADPEGDFMVEAFACFPDVVISLLTLGVTAETGGEWTASEEERACLREWLREEDLAELFAETDEQDIGALTGFFGCVPSLIAALIAAETGTSVPELSDEERACLREWATDDSAALIAAYETEDPLAAIASISGVLECLPDLVVPRRAEAVPSDPIEVDESLLWHHPTGIYEDAFTAVSVDQGTVFAVSNDGVAHALDGETGETIWEADIDASSYSKPVVTREAVYFEIGDSLYALDRASGEVRWKHNANHTWFTPHAPNNGVVYLESMEAPGGVPLWTALNENTGEVLWQLDKQRNAPLVVGDTFFMTWEGDVIALDARSGEVKWRHECESMPAVYEGIAYCSSDETAYGVDNATGERLWEFALPSGRGEDKAVVEEGVYYLWTWDALYAIDIDASALLWSYESKDGMQVQSNPVVADGILYVGIYPEGMYALDAKTGEQVWHKGEFDEREPPEVMDGVFFRYSDAVQNERALQARNAATGELIQTFGSTPLDYEVEDGVLYVASGWGGMYAYVVPDPANVSASTAIPGATSTPTPAPAAPFTIGVMEALTGPGETYGSVALQAKQMAVEEINGAGGVNSRSLELIVEDSKCSARDAITVYNKLTDVEGVKVILGPSCSGAMLGVAPLAERDGVVLFSGLAANPAIALAGEYIFRTAMSDAQVGLDTGNLLWADGIRRLATITESTDHAEGVTRYSVAQFESRGGVVVAEEQYAPDTSDFRPQLRRLLGATPDAIHIAAQAEFAGGTVVKQLHELGYRGPVYSEAVIVGPKALEIAGDAATGLKAVVAELDPANVYAQGVLARYRERYEYVTLPWYLGSAYDDVYITAECLKQTGDDQDADGLRDCLYDITWNGAIGTNYGFDQDGEVEGVWHMVVEVLPLSERTEDNRGYRVIGPAPDSDIDDDHANSIEGATATTVGKAVQGALDYERDIDYFRFTAEEGTLYRIEVTLGTLDDSWVTLLDSDGEALWGNDDSGLTSAPHFIWEAPDSRDYYVDVRAAWGPGTGSYKLTVTGIMEDHGYYADSATATAVGESVAGTLGFQGDVDYFRFTAEEGTLYQIDVELGTLSYSFFSLHDSDGESLNGKDVYADTPAPGITWEAPSSGAYYVSVESYDTGSYTLSVTLSDIVDDHGNNLDGATAVAVGKNTGGAIDYKGDVDHFHFTARKGTLYQIDVVLVTLDDSKVALLDSDGLERRYNDDFGDSPASRIVWEAPESGDYYVAVYGWPGTGSYTMKVSTETPAHKEPIVFSDLNWASVQLQNRIAQYIVEMGYGYPTDAVFGAMLPLFNALRAGETDVTMEIWLPNQDEVWNAALDEGEVVPVGTTLGGHWQSAFVIPAYLQDVYPGLDSVEDLKEHRYKDLFTTPESRWKALLVSCPITWDCAWVNAAQIEAYGLSEHVEIVNPVDNEDLNRIVSEAYERRDPWLGYQWATSDPALKLDLVRLEEPAYSDECWFTTKACGYEDATILIAVSRDLPARAPDVIEMLRAWDFNVDIYSDTVRWQAENPDADVNATAIWWLNNNADIWMGWVTAKAAAAILAALGAGEVPYGWPDG